MLAKTKRIPIALCLLFNLSITNLERPMWLAKKSRAKGMPQTRELKLMQLKQLDDELDCDRTNDRVNCSIILEDVPGH